MRHSRAANQVLRGAGLFPLQSRNHAGSARPRHRFTRNHPERSEDTHLSIQSGASLAQSIIGKRLTTHRPLRTRLIGMPVALSAPKHFIPRSVSNVWRIDALQCLFPMSAPCSTGAHVSALWPLLLSFTVLSIAHCDTPLIKRKLRRFWQAVKSDVAVMSGIATCYEFFASRSVLNEAIPSSAVGT